MRSPRPIRAEDKKPDISLLLIAGLVLMAGFFLFKALSPKETPELADRPEVEQRSAKIVTAAKPQPRAIPAPPKTAARPQHVHSAETSHRHPEKREAVKVPSVDKETDRKVTTLLHSVADDFNTGNFDQAISSLKAALKLNPDHPHAMEGLAMAYLMKGDFAAAQAQFVQVLEKDPSNYLALEKLVELGEYNGSPEQTVQFLNEHMAKNPDSHAAASVLGSYLSRKGDPTAAAPLLEQAYQQAQAQGLPTGALAMEQSDAAAAAGDTERAKAITDREAQNTANALTAGTLPPHQQTIKQDELQAFENAFQPVDAEQPPAPGDQQTARTAEQTEK